jgi:membrane protease YdiL (CAAX protease family)
VAVFRDLIAAHALRFERPERSPCDAATGSRLVQAFVLVGLVLQPALPALARATGLAHSFWIAPAIVAGLLVATILTMAWFVRAGGGAIGLRPWSAWSARERIYLVTVAPLAIVVFGILFRGRFERLAEVQGWTRLWLLSVPTGLLWGFVQELLYRGFLQTELVRRMGAVPGVLLANLVFTFGPLHFNYFGLGTGSGPNWGMFAAIFGIGLFFGIVYQRSGNLWIPALLHGIWPLNVT